jgi:hypothetical protein
VGSSVGSAVGGAISTGVRVEGDGVSVRLNEIEQAEAVSVRQIKKKIFLIFFIIPPIAFHYKAFYLPWSKIKIYF